MFDVSYATMRKITLGYLVFLGDLSETTSTNPQFFVQIPQTASAKCHVVVSVTQHYETRTDEPKKRRPMHAIGFAVYEVPPNVTRLTSHFVSEHVSLHTYFLDMSLAFFSQLQRNKNNNILKQVKVRVKRVYLYALHT